MSLDVSTLRAEFPSLSSGIAHFDGPGGTQTPAAVGTAVAAALTGPLSNRGGSVSSERNADTAVRQFRSAAADLLGTSAEGIVYGRSATALTYDFSRHLAKTWTAGDEVVVSRLDHDANVRPWIQAAEHAGATVRWIDFNPETSEIDMATAEEVINERTKLVAITAASNLLGTKPAVRLVADIAHAAGSLVYVDGVHYTAHSPVSTVDLGADFFVCSPYKFLGPHCGILAADPTLLNSLTPDKLLPSTNQVPERFEFGTLPYEMMAGVTAAVNFLADIAPGSASTRREQLENTFNVLEMHEAAMRGHIETQLAALEGQVVLHSRAEDRTPTLLFTLPGRKTSDAAAFLAERDVLAPAGSFYAYEPFRRLNVTDSGGLRVGLAPYNNQDDVDRLVNGIKEFLTTS